jgi:hypothetical protein
VVYIGSSNNILLSPRTRAFIYCTSVNKNSLLSHRLPSIALVEDSIWEALAFVVVRVQAPCSGVILPLVSSGSLTDCLQDYNPNVDTRSGQSRITCSLQAMDSAAYSDSLSFFPVTRHSFRSLNFDYTTPSRSPLPNYRLRSELWKREI